MTIKIQYGNKKMRLLGLLLILLLGGSHIAEAGMREALNFLRRDDYASALPHLNEAAIEGRTSAQVLLAQLYLEGKFGKPEPKKAAGWFKKAALANPRNGSFVAIGDGDQNAGGPFIKQFRELSSLDIVGHELTHASDDRTRAG